MITADLHIHSVASEDSETPVGEIVSAAVKRGLNVIAVTDHVELVDFQKGAYDVAAAESWELLKTVQAPNGLRVARGIELGEPCFDKNLAATLLDAHPYDFVLASQHRLSDARQDYYFIDYSDWTHDAIVREMEAYFRELLRVVQWNGFDSLAHLTYPFRYLPSCWREGDYRPWRGVIDTVLGTLAENGKSLEINTSGIRKGLGQTSPDLPLIRRFRELGGERVTVGSDAHRPEEIGADLSVAEALMREAGFSAYTVYFDRQPQTVSIDENK